MRTRFLPVEFRLDRWNGPRLGHSNFRASIRGEGSVRPKKKKQHHGSEACLMWRSRFAFFKVRENKGKQQQHSGRMRPLEISFIFHEYESRPGEIETKTKRTEYCHSAFDFCYAKYLLPKIR